MFMLIKKHKPNFIFFKDKLRGDMMNKKDFERFLKFNNLSIKVQSIGNGYKSLQVFYNEHLIADMNEFKGELNLDWAYEYIMDLPGDTYFISTLNIYKKVPKFRSIEEVKNIPIL